MLISSIGMYLSMRAMSYGSRIDIATGIVIVMIGIIGMGMNLPIYKKLLERSNQKYAFDIIELARQICEAEELSPCGNFWVHNRMQSILHKGYLCS